MGIEELVSAGDGGPDGGEAEAGEEEGGEEGEEDEHAWHRARRAARPSGGGRGRGRAQEDSRCWTAGGSGAWRPRLSSPAPAVFNPLSNSLSQPPGPRNWPRRASLDLASSDERPL